LHVFTSLVFVAGVLGQSSGKIGQRERETLQ